jgi:hypothetical protein
VISRVQGKIQGFDGRLDELMSAKVAERLTLQRDGQLKADRQQGKSGKRGFRRLNRAELCRFLGANRRFGGTG